MRATVLILTALLAAACSSGRGETPPASIPATPVPSVTMSMAGVEKCSRVAQEDQPVTDTLIGKGCVGDDGIQRFGKVTPCKDGRRLWEMDDLIGFSGELIFQRETKIEGGVPVAVLYYRVCQG